MGQELLFKCDWGARYPLWLEGRMADAERLGLSSGLAADLRALQVYFDEHQAPLDGWSSAAVLAEFQRTRDGLRSRLEAELGGRFIVVVR